MWLETIQIRTGGNQTEQIAEKITRMLDDLEQNGDSPDIVLFRHGSLPSDFNLHLSHRNRSSPPEKSQTGLQLAASLKELGLISHTIWVLEKNNGKKQHAKTVNQETT